MSIWERICRSADFWYLQYLIYTALYMCEEWEIRLFNSVMIASIAMASYTAYLFLPGHIAMLMYYFNYMMGNIQSETTETAAST